MLNRYLFCCEPVVIRYNLSVFESTRHITDNVLIIQFVILVKVVFKGLLVYGNKKQYLVKLYVMLVL